MLLECVSSACFCLYLLQSVECWQREIRPREESRAVELADRGFGIRIWKHELLVLVTQLTVQCTVLLLGLAEQVLQLPLALLATIILPLQSIELLCL